ncbi:hypothetical protein CDAR_267931 [Caerostris darwini]|uniref:Secreted protein n=1 Tax=Caerostris darwini TaxID=1538125 RepID=A0AAV4RP58_9ARAC|nr:hypothetical protein CDAR_267931 [Caerostris darwini]
MQSLLTIFRFCCEILLFQLRRIHRKVRWNGVTGLLNNALSRWGRRPTPRQVTSGETSRMEHAGRSSGGMLLDVDSAAQRKWANRSRLGRPISLGAAAFLRLQKFFSFCGRK